MRLTSKDFQDLQDAIQAIEDGFPGEAKMLIREVLLRVEVA